jgi:adenylate cyclase class 2
MKVRDEYETVIGDGEVVQRVLEEVGLHVWFRYEKYREEYAAEDVTIAIDETPVGTFVEIEGGEEGILAMTMALGRTRSDFVLDSYRGLFIKHRSEFGLTGTNMVFTTE